MPVQIDGEADIERIASPVTRYPDTTRQARMFYRIAADITLLSHLLFIAFAVLGGLCVLRYPKLIFLHLPAALWAVYIEISGGVCPLTILENSLRMRAGQAGIENSFIEHYLLPMIYPAGLTRDTQFILAAIVLVINGIIYGWIAYRRYQHDFVRNKKP